MDCGCLSILFVGAALGIINNDGGRFALETKSIMWDYKTKNRKNIAAGSWATCPTEQTASQDDGGVDF